MSNVLNLKDSKLMDVVNSTFGVSDLVGIHNSGSASPAFFINESGMLSFSVTGVTADVKFTEKLVAVHDADSTYENQLNRQLIVESTISTQSREKEQQLVAAQSKLINRSKNIFEKKNLAPLGVPTGIEINTEGMIEDTKSLTIAAGVTLICGYSNSGKSTFAYNLHDRIKNSVFFSWGEPDSVSYSSNIVLINTLNKEFFDNERSVFVLDSLKNFTFISGGSTGAGGFNNEFYLAMSNMNSQLAMLDKYLICVFNPLSVSQSTYEVILSALIGSVSNVFALGDIRAENGAFKFTSRYENRRELRSLRRLVGDDKKVDLTSSSCEDDSVIITVL